MKYRRLMLLIPYIPLGAFMILGFLMNWKIISSFAETEAWNVLKAQIEPYIQIWLITCIVQLIMGALLIWKFRVGSYQRITGETSGIGRASGVMRNGSF